MTQTSCGTWHAWRPRGGHAGHASRHQFPTGMVQARSSAGHPSGALDQPERGRSPGGPRGPDSDQDKHRHQRNRRSENPVEALDPLLERQQPLPGRVPRPEPPRRRTQRTFMTALRHDWPAALPRIRNLQPILIEKLGFRVSDLRPQDRIRPGAPGCAGRGSGGKSRGSPRGGECAGSARAVLEAADRQAPGRSGAVDRRV